MRPDKRANNELRPIRITTGFIPNASGSVLIEFGYTKVICTATVEEKVPPFLKGTGRGWVTGEYSMLPASTQVRKPRESSKGKLEGRTQEIQRLIGRSHRSVVNLDKIGERTIWIDCDVIQADGGTRTASVTGGFIALVHCVDWMLKQGMIEKSPINNYIAAVSVGIYDGQAILDLCYEEDFNAKVDMNLVMTDKGEITEIQGTGEGQPFTMEELNQMLLLGRYGIKELIAKQEEALGELNILVGIQP
ncbi:MAG: ribonuclease PH [Caldicoprobacterales bacterium]|jgi:ribonuclease PH|nr:ribonuclease PH [Clostridiales bacterium]